MSKLMRMNILGIRSFGPDDEDVQQIKFFSPLTLIQGQNGCGKTTIIEALKYAITGDLPGGTGRGQGFVYDPKLAKAFETRGQVKLRITDTKGELVTVTKSVSVLQRTKEKMEFKSLDSALVRGKGGPQISGKCVDVIAEMCLAMGVSKSILNNVIFCHQEDSNWPLDEDKKLKEKFDDIFDATNYNKCLENLWKYIKKLQDEQKVRTAQLHGLEDIKITAEAKRNMLQEKEHRLQALIDEIADIDDQSIPLNTKIIEIEAIEMNFNELHANFVSKTKELGHLKEQQQDLLVNITEFTGSDEELRQKLTTFEDDLNSIQSEITVLDRKKMEIEKTESRLRSAVNDQQKILGQLQAEETQHQSTITNRNKLLTVLIKDLQINTDPNDLEHNKIKPIINSLKTKLEENKQNLLDLGTELDSEEKAGQTKIDEIRETSAQLKQNIDSKRKQISENQIELKHTKQKLQELITADNQLKLVESQMLRLEKEYNALSASVNTDQLRGNIEKEKLNCNRLEERLTLVENEIQTLQTYTTLQTELDLKNETNISKEIDLQKLKNKHEDTFKQIFPAGLPKSDLKSNIITINRTQSQLIRELQNKIQAKQNNVMKLETTLKIQQNKLADYEKELNKSTMELSSMCQDKSLESMIKETQANLEKIQNHRATLESSKYIFKRYIDQFKEAKPCCPICKRDVQEKEFATRIINDLEKKIITIPDQIIDADKQLLETKSLYEKLLNLKPIYDKQLKLKHDDVPKLQQEVTTLTQKLNTDSSDLNSLRHDLKHPQLIQELTNFVIGDSALIDQYQKDLTRLKLEIESISARIPHDDTSRGIQEALSEQETLKIDLKTSRNRVESDRNKLTQHTDRLQKQKEQQNELISKKLNIRKNLQDKDLLVTKNMELETKTTNLQTELQELITKVQPLQIELNTAMKTLEELKKLNRSKLDRSRSVHNDLKIKIDSIIKLQQTIDEFIVKNIQNQIDSANATITKFEQELQQYSTKKTAINSDVDELKVRITNGKVYFRELHDNIQLRAKRKQATSLQVEITELHHQIGNSNIQKIRRDKEMHLRKLTTLQQQKQRLTGNKEELKTSIRELNSELAQTKYVKAAYNYKRKFLELNLNEKSMADLREFRKAMDWSMLQFHKQRMVQINSIIKDLWRSIYKGNDIDYIEIKTDDTTQGTERRKVFKYRVVQVKNQTELEMRGRCSAGQKVLASLIIRIALADTFSTNCGILALDEPTTNLDRKNINSLCEALIDLIDQKKKQKNFQLLIITHDQDFVDKLNRVETLESYYVIRRNEFGKSTISLQYR